MLASNVKKKKKIKGERKRNPHKIGKVNLKDLGMSL